MLVLGYVVLTKISWAAPKSCGKVSALARPHLECCVQLWMQLSCWADFKKVQQHFHLQTVDITLSTALEASAGWSLVLQKDLVWLWLG